MRSTLLLGAVATAAIVGCSSGGGVQVRTSADPDANLAGLHSFYVLTAPTRSANASRSRRKIQCLTTPSPIARFAVT